MTTTHDVPMPEPLFLALFDRYKDRYVTAPAKSSRLPPIGDFMAYSDEDLRAYADARCAKLQEERDALAKKVKALHESARGAMRCLCEQVLPIEQDSIDIINSTIIDLQSVLYATPVDAAIDAAGDQP